MLLADLMPEALEVIRERARAEAREKGLAEGRAEGIEKGIVEGLETGSKRKYREVLIKLLTKKLKGGPDKTLIEKASEDSLNKIEDRIFEIESWEEVEKILK